MVLSPLLATTTQSSLASQVLLLMAIILVAAQALGWFAQRLGQPRVVGEIAAGLLLGPSFFGWLSPELASRVFQPQATQVLAVMGELGLVLLMFLIGLESPLSQLRQARAAAVGVSVGGWLFPLILGGLLGSFTHSSVAAEVDRTGYILFLAIALSITAIPVLSRILVELQLTGTPLGVLTLTAAGLDDAFGWVALAAISAMVSGQFQTAIVARMIASLVLFVAVVWGAIRPMANWLASRGLLKRSQSRDRAELFLLLLAVLAAALTTSAIGIFALFGPLVLGIALAGIPGLRERMAQQLEPLVFTLLLPMFFTSTGLKTDIGTLVSPTQWLACAAVLLIAITGKFAGCGLLARVGGFSPRHSIAIAALMNARGLIELVVIQIGRELGVIPPNVSCMLVLMTLVTTLMATPLARWSLSGEPAAELRGQ